VLEVEHAVPFTTINNKALDRFNFNMVRGQHPGRRRPWGAAPPAGTEPRLAGRELAAFRAWLATEAAAAGVRLLSFVEGDELVVRLFPSGVEALRFRRDTPPDEARRLVRESLAALPADSDTDPAWPPSAGRSATFEDFNPPAA
jgi:hypothetical protein